MRSYLLNLMVFALAATAVADTIVMKDGRRFTGTVNVTRDGYTIHTRLGVATVLEHEVEEWIRGDDPAPSPWIRPATQPIKPVTRPTTVASTVPGSALTTRAVAQTTQPSGTIPDPSPTTDPAPIARVDPPPDSGRPKPSPGDGPRRQRGTRYAAAFPVSADLLIAPAAALENATEIQVQAANGDAIRASVMQKDVKAGLALLKVTGHRMKYFALDEEFTAGDVTCPAYLEVDLFEPKSELLPAVLRSGNGGATARFAKHPGLAGPPLLANGRVVGVMMSADKVRVDAVPVIPAAQIRKLAGDRIGAQPAKLADPRTSLYQLVITFERR